ncbi:hypothetical protein BDZ91DRAFT_432512 [Kalaharituber pfeilii]|nr:hypothetical protein BDZ91DRAFT_432512 [Kalaharituber pfeilii]
MGMESDSPPKSSWIMRLIARVEERMRTALKNFEQKFAAMLQNLRQLVDKGVEDIQKDIRNLERQFNQLQSEFNSSRAARDNGHYDLAIQRMHNTVERFNEWAPAAFPDIKIMSEKSSTLCRWMDCNYLLDNTPTLPQNSHHALSQSTTDIGLANVGVGPAERDFQYRQSLDLQATVIHDTSVPFVKPPGSFEVGIAIQTPQPDQVCGIDPRFSLMDNPHYVDTTYTLGLGSSQNFVPPIVSFGQPIELPAQGDQESSIRIMNLPSHQPSTITLDNPPAPAGQHRKRVSQSQRKDSWFKCRFQSCSNRNAERSDNFRKHLKMNHKTALRNCLGLEPYEIPSGMELTEIINSFNLGDASLWRVDPPRTLAWKLKEDRALVSRKLKKRWMS